MKFPTLVVACIIALAPLFTQAETVSIDLPAAPVIIASPAVEISLTASPTSIAVGQDVVYTLTISNTGDADFTNLSAQFDLPAGFSFIDGTSPSALKKLGTLAPQAQVTKTFTLRAGSDAVAGNIPLEVLVDADEFDLNETIAIVNVRDGEVLGAETLVETGNSPTTIFVVGLGAIIFGGVLGLRQKFR